MTSLKPVIEQEGVSSGSFRMMSTPHQVDREAGGQLLQCTRSHATKDLNGHVRSSSGQDHTTIRYCCSQSMNSKMKNAKNKCRDQKNQVVHSVMIIYSFHTFKMHAAARDLKTTAK